MQIVIPLTLPHPMSATGATLAPHSGRDDEAFDAWVHRELSQANDAVLREPVPERLLRVLRPSAN